MQNKITILRWLLLVPFAIGGWYVALLIGIMLYAVADLFCPTELMISGGCQASWYAPVIDGLIIFGAGLSAVFVILFSILMAPANKVTIARVAYVSGFFVALYFAHGTSAWGAFFGAAISGALTLLFLHRHVNKGKKCA